MSRHPMDIVKLCEEIGRPIAIEQNGQGYYAFILDTDTYVRKHYGYGKTKALAMLSLKNRYDKKTKYRWRH